MVQRDVELAFCDDGFDDYTMNLVMIMVMMMTIYCNILPMSMKIDGVDKGLTVLVCYRRSV